MATEEVIIRRRRFNWPEAQLNIWIFIVLCLAAAELGMFAWFMAVQTQMQLGTPWLFPYIVCVGALSLLFLVVLLVLAANRFLVPGIILIGAFMLFVLWLTGLIETAIQLYGTGSNVNGNCNSLPEYRGPNIDTLAWITQNNICNCWKAAFGMQVVLVVFFLYLIIMAWQVHNDGFD